MSLLEHIVLAWLVGYVPTMLSLAYVSLAEPMQGETWDELEQEAIQGWWDDLKRALLWPWFLWRPW